MSVDPIKPYAQLAKVIAIAVALMFCVGMTFMGGRAVGKGQAAKTIAAKDKALLSASSSLGAAADALRAVNAEAKRRIAADAQAKRDADSAAIAAMSAQHEAEAQLLFYRNAVAKARVRTKCAQLLDADLAKVCGL